jgi:hypothetical protein
MPIKAEFFAGSCCDLPNNRTLEVQNYWVKRTAAILLIIILFFNWYGYKLVTAFLQKKADHHLEARLDNNDYDESQLIEIRVALDMPYQTSQSEFERHYGEIEIDGKSYTYVKRKIEDGYLVLKCIYNNSRDNIKSAGNDFYKMANGLDQNQSDKKQGNNSSVAKNFWSEYDDHSNSFAINSLDNLSGIAFRTDPSSLYNTWQSTPKQPPKNC